VIFGAFFALLWPGVPLQYWAGAAIVLKRLLECRRTALLGAGELEFGICSQKRVFTCLAGRKQLSEQALRTKKKGIQDKGTAHDGSRGQPFGRELRDDINCGLGPSVPGHRGTICGARRSWPRSHIGGFFEISSIPRGSEGPSRERRPSVGFDSSGRRKKRPQPSALIQGRAELSGASGHAPRRNEKRAFRR